MAAPHSWLFDVFGWDKLMAVVTVFAALSSTAFIPLYHLYRKRTEKKREQYEKEHLERIDRNIKPLEFKIAELEELIKGLQHDIRDLRSTLTTISNEFHKYQEKQENTNKKVYYMDGMFRRMTGLRGPSDNSNGYGE